MNRRGFFASLFGAAVAPTVAKALPAPALRLDRAAFKAVGRPILKARGLKIGDTIQIRKPARFLVKSDDYYFRRDEFELKTLQTAEDAAKAMEVI